MGIIFGDQSLNSFEMLVLALNATNYILFSLRRVIQIPLIDNLSHFLQNIEVLGGISLSFFEFREVLNNSLHVFDRVKLCLALLFLKERLNQRVNGVSHISEVVEHNLSEKFVILTRENNLLHFIGEVRQML